MNKDDELTIELAKNKADEYIIKKELEKEKQSFISSLQNGIGNEILNSDNAYYNKPISIKKPFKVKVKEFFNNIGRVLGI